MDKNEKKEMPKMSPAPKMQYASFPEPPKMTFEKPPEVIMKIPENVVFQNAEEAPKEK